MLYHNFAVRTHGERRKPQGEAQIIDSMFSETPGIFDFIGVSRLLYHGTSVAGLKRLRPTLSEHGKPYIYFASNMTVATFYTVHRVERPYNWFPYGFDKNGVPVYDEYYPDALADVYSGKTGYIYLCENISDIQNPTNINCAYVCEKDVDVNDVIEIADMYEWFLERENLGELRINRYENLTQRQKERFGRIILSEIEENGLKQNPDCGYAKFIKEKFPDVWG